MKSLTMFKNQALLIFFLLALSAGCVKAPYTEREQFIMMSRQEEIELGAAAFADIRKKSVTSSDPEENALLRRVGKRIAVAADQPDFNWEFILIDDKKTVNAFALPGGKVSFYTGILPICRDDIGVAVVMGHEVAHVLARHGAERMSQQRLFAIGQAALLAAVGGRDPATQEAVLNAYGIGAHVGVLLPYSRTQESEADKIGLILMAKAGYDPYAAVDFWKRMLEQSKGRKSFELLATHPGDEKRIREIEAFLPIAMEYYNRATENPALKPPQPAR